MPRVSPCDAAPVNDPAPAAACGPHGAPSVALCYRCGAFVCSSCRRWQAEKPLCTGCVQRLGEKPSAQATIALAVATVGFCGFLPGIPAVFLARRELRRIRECQAPAAGESLATLAQGLGWFHVIAFAATLLVVATR